MSTFAAAAGAARTASPPILDVSGEIVPLRELIRGVGAHWRLLPMLARQDYVARYRSAALGLLWSVFLPLLQAAVLAVVFSRVVRVHSGTPSYAVFVLAGMTAWGYLSTSWSLGATSIVDGAAIASRVYFPRLLLPAVAPTANLIGYAIGSAVLLLVMAAVSAPFHVTLLLLPLAMALAYALVTLLNAVCALLHVYFRDVRYLVSALLMVLFYATPVIYPLTMVHGALRTLVLLNPATGVIQLTRFAVFGSADSLAAALLITGGWIATLAVLTLLAYARHERIAVDRL
jgi:ABC-type polysaccharide/polyol phosphate export permease